MFLVPACYIPETELQITDHGGFITNRNHSPREADVNFNVYVCYKKKQTKTRQSED